MAVIWPVALDVKPLADAFDEQPPRIAIRTPMDSGPPKTRRKLSNNSRLINIDLVLTAGEMDDFDDFFMTSLLGGVLRFTWVHPRTLDTIESRILADESQGPKYRMENGLYRANFILEVLP